MAKTNKKGLGGMSLAKLAIIAGICALVVVCGISIKNIIDLHGEQSRLREENAKLTSEKENLEAELKNVNDLDYIEEQARKQLKMIKPGEVLFVLDESGTPHVVEPDDNGELPRPEDPGIIEAGESVGADEYQYYEESSEEYTEDYGETAEEYVEYTEEYSEPEVIESPEDSEVPEEPVYDQTEEGGEEPVYSGEPEYVPEEGGE